MRMANDYHHVVYCPDWDKADIERAWGMTFVDHSPGSRHKVEVARLADLAEYIVIHDSQKRTRQGYKFNPALGEWRSRYDYTKLLPWTSAVSNFHDLAFLGAP